MELVVPTELYYAKQDIRLASGDYDTEKAVRVELYRAQVAGQILKNDPRQKRSRCGGKPVPVVMCNRRWLFPWLGERIFFSVEQAARFLKAEGRTEASEPDSCVRTALRRRASFGNALWRRLDPGELVRLVPKTRPRRPRRKPPADQPTLFV